MAASAATPFTNPAATWNKRFEATGFVFGTEPNAWLREQAHRWQPGQRVLCVADGEGRNSVWLARQGLQVDAFDIADVGVTKARGLAKAAGVQVDFAVCDCDAVAWPQAAYDGVVAIFVQFADPATRARLFANMLAACAPAASWCCRATPRNNWSTRPAARRSRRTCTRPRCCATHSLAPTSWTCANMKPTWPKARVTMAVPR